MPSQPIDNPGAPLYRTLALNMRGSPCACYFCARKRRKIGRNLHKKPAAGGFALA